MTPSPVYFTCPLQQKRPWRGSKIQLTLDQHRFELCRCTYTWIFSITTVNIFLFLMIFLETFFSSGLLCCKNTLYNTYNTYKIYVKLFMLLVRLPINSRLSVVKFLGFQKFYVNFPLRRSGGNVSTTKTHIVQESTVMR